MPRPIHHWPVHLADLRAALDRHAISPREHAELVRDLERATNPRQAEAVMAARRAMCS